MLWLNQIQIVTLNANNKKLSLHTHFMAKSDQTITLRVFPCLHYYAYGETGSYVLKNTPCNKSWWENQLFSIKSR